MIVIGATTGCTANHRPSDGSPVAKLLFTTNKSPGMLVGLWTIKAGVCQSNGKTHLLTNSETDKSGASVDIDAGRPFVVKAEMVNISTGQRCNAAGIFTPLPGQAYRLKHTIVMDMCWLEMFKETTIEKEPSFKQLVNLNDKSICSALTR